MPKTNPREEQVLNFIREFSAENGYAPSIREICAGVGLRSTASVNYHLKNLQQKGLLTLGEKGRKRAIAAPQRPGQIPLIGTVTAGLPILALENREGTISWDGDPTCFALRVRGDSMINAGIFSGDVVVVRPQPTADDGQIVVARLEDEATVKRLRRHDGQIWLMPENEAYAPIDGTYAQIVGVVKALVREY
ncbi:MAG TPA: transcriptional repressor LexA [Candidatus Faecousia excrementipullorum]|nr:transcriptional repressor LexA [Candidatus Faecousia excrementipullorum]